MDELKSQSSFGSKLLFTEGKPGINRDDYTTVPVLIGFDMTRSIGELRVLTEHLPPRPNFVFALGYEVDSRLPPGQIPTAPDDGPYRLKCVSMANDEAYAGYLQQVGIAPQAWSATLSAFEQVDEADERDREVGRKWREDSSLENWFPLTAEELARLRNEVAALRNTAPPQAAPVPVNAEQTLQEICDLFGIGGEARTPYTILTNIQNTKRFADYLHAIEREFFMVPGEPDDDYPDDEPAPECLLNCWGSSQQEYVEQFRAALVRLTAAAGPKADDWPAVPLPMSTAPRDGTIVRLLVQFTDNATEDTVGPAWTIGGNTCEGTGENVWQFAGWNWEQDCFTEGDGTPIGWLPMVGSPQAATEAVEGDGLGAGGRYWRERAEFWRAQAVSLGWRQKRDTENGEAQTLEQPAVELDELEAHECYYENGDGVCRDCNELAKRAARRRAMEVASVPTDTLDRLQSGRATEGDQMIAYNALATFAIIDGAKAGRPTKGEARLSRQRAVHEWCIAAFGDNHARSIRQRGIRLVEEAIETGQACGCDPEMVHRLIDHIYAKPKGELFQELGGVGVTMLALSEAAKIDADLAERTEIARVLSKPLEHFTARNAAKNAAGFNVLAGADYQPSEAGKGCDA